MRDRGASITLVALAAGVVLLPFQWLPALPLPGLTVSDLCFSVALVVFGTTGQALRFRPCAAKRSALVPCLAMFAFALGATASAVGNAGSYLKLAGHWELVLVGGLVALLCTARQTAWMFRRALVAAALLAATTAVIGVVLWGLAIETPLLNPVPGDLEASNYPRVRGTLVRANMMATVVATGSCLLAAEPGLVGRRRLVLWSSWVLLGVALLFSFSRTVPCLLLILGALWTWRRRRAAPLRVGIVVVALLYLVALGFASRFQVVLDPTRPWQAAIDFSAPGTRWVYAAAARDAIVEHPWLGLGPGHVSSLGFSAHFTWLNVWMVLGILPLFAFAVLVWRLLDLRLLRAAPGPYAAMVLLGFDSLHRDVEDFRHLWIVAGLLVASILGLQENDK